MSEYRNKPTVEAGIQSRTDMGGGNEVVVYEPGNGTRYVLVLTTITEPEAASQLGCSKGSVLVTFPNTGKSMFLDRKAGPVFSYYVQEKLRCSDPDAEVQTELLGYLLGREFVGLCRLG